MAQIARGHALGDLEGLVERDHDLAGDGPGGENAEDQRQHGGQQQQLFSVGGIGIAHGGLGGGEFFAVPQQDIALGGHDFQRGGAGHLGVAVLGDGGAVGLQGHAGLLQVGLVLLRQLALQVGDFLQGIVDGIQGWLLGFGLAAVGITAHLEARLLDQLAQVDHAVELRDAVALQQGRFDFVDLGHGVVGSVTELAACALALEAGQDHSAKGFFVLAQGLLLLLDQGFVVGLLDQRFGGFEAIVQLLQQAVDGVGALFAPAHFKVQARQAQVFGQAVEAGDKAQLVATTGHVAQAGPTGEGGHQRQDQHQAKAYAQLAIDAHIPQFFG
ncbi:hypothetical protein [Pseudomonas sp. 22 E 5]|nr:hypothetical protein [Pseudomonas sp. 22 E 5]